MSLYSGGSCVRHRTDYARNNFVWREDLGLGAGPGWESWTSFDNFGRTVDDSWRHFVRACTTTATLKSLLLLEFCKNPVTEKALAQSRHRGIWTRQLPRTRMHAQGSIAVPPTIRPLAQPSALMDSVRSPFTQLTHKNPLILIAFPHSKANIREYSNVRVKLSDRSSEMQTAHLRKISSSNTGGISQCVN